MFWKQNNEEKYPRKIYIDRSDNSLKSPPQRLLKNEEEIKKYLLKNNFVSVKLHETEFSDQVNLFYNAEFIVGLHGGGFANLAFCRPKTKVIELKSVNAGTPIENLAIKNDLNYDSIAVEAEQLEKFDFPNQQGSIEIPIKNLIRLLESKNIWKI